MTRARKLKGANFRRTRTPLESGAAAFMRSSPPTLLPLLPILHFIKYNYCFLIIVFESSRAKRAVFFCQNQVGRYKKS